MFDTQIAAGFAGFSAQAGYNGLLHDVLKRLAKTASFTRWDARPLTEEQLRYARGDVEHLLALRDEIATRLEARGRLEWAREECRAIAEATDERDPDEVWRRLPRVNGLDARDRAVARELAAWRERTAAEEDRPVGSVLRDPTVVELAKRQPAAAASWPRSAASTRTWCAAAAAVLEAIARGKEAEPVHLDDGDRLQTESVDGPVIALAEALVRSRAQAAGLAYELIAARADLAPIVVAARRGGARARRAHAAGLAPRARRRRACWGELRRRPRGRRGGCRDRSGARGGARWSIGRRPAAAARQRETVAVGDQRA